MRGNGKQCRDRPDATEGGVWSESILFPLNIGNSAKSGDNKRTMMVLYRSHELINLPI